MCVEHNLNLNLNLNLNSHLCEGVHGYCIREVGGWGRDPKKCTGRDWGMGSSTIE